jgi:pantoate--beta-alanine ligase
MKIFKNKKSLINEISDLKNIAFVPTMGALHAGHISLIKKAKKKSNKVLVSIYVNPKQFNTKKDFNKYPKKIHSDIKVLKSIGVKYLYVPSNRDIYSFKPKLKIHLDAFSRILCGKFRPNHFKGVINIVNRFLEIIKPQWLYLGMKDFQQLSLIESHIIKNKIKTNVIVCPIIRGDSGTALSSRNFKLSGNQLIISGIIYKFIQKNKKLILNKILNNKRSEVINKLVKLGANKIEYIECVDLNKKKICTNAKYKFNVFVSYYIGSVRLIDNL